MAILAATTLGRTDIGTVRAEVRAAAPLAVDDRARYRLVVQTYEDGEGLPTERRRPTGSVQLAVTGAELRSGVRVDLVELREPAAPRGSEPVVVAWVEDGQADLELDGLRARPAAGAIYGEAPLDDGPVQIALTKLMAA
jgi:hypothetical protein